MRSAAVSTRDETFVSYALSDDFVTSSDCAAKLLLFFDMAMGWSGLRACAPMIGQSKKKNTRSNRSNIGNYAEYDKIYSSYINYSGYSL